MTCRRPGEGNCAVRFQLQLGRLPAGQWPLALHCCPAAAAPVAREIAACPCSSCTSYAHRAVGWLENAPAWLDGSPQARHTPPPEKLPHASPPLLQANQRICLPPTFSACQYVRTSGEWRRAAVVHCLRRSGRVCLDGKCGPRQQSASCRASWGWLACHTLEHYCMYCPAARLHSVAAFQPARRFPSCRARSGMAGSPAGH